MNFPGYYGMHYNDDLPPPPGVDSEHFPGLRDQDLRERDRMRRHDRSRSRDYRHERDDLYGDKIDGRNFYDEGYAYGSKRYSGYDRVDDYDRFDRFEDRDDRRIYRDRDRFRERERERGRERDRDRERERTREREHSRDRERNRERDRERERVRERDWREEIPNNTIMVRGLASHITENDIKNEITRYGLQVKDIRLMRKKETGISRGFAFVEFSLLSEAVRWKELTQGVLFTDEQQRATLHYSIPKDMAGPDRGLLNKADWTCSKCGVNNFRRRDLCFKCNTPRDDSEILMQGGDGYDEVSSYPSNTLLFRNLDVLTTEERVLSMLGQLTMLPIKSLRVAKDSLTNTSRGFAFVELHSTSEATQLHDLLLSMAGNFYVDGRQVTVSYARRSLSSMNGSASASAASAALAAAQWTNQGTACDGTSQQHSYGGLESGTVQGFTDAPSLPNREFFSDLGTIIVDNVIYKKYPLPDVSSYKYDESSGYYYDSSTGLYYDSNSQYYYNCETQQFLYWDSERQTYLPAPTEKAAVNTSTISADAQQYSSTVCTSAPPVLNTQRSTENADVKSENSAISSDKKGNEAQDKSKDKSGKQDKVKIAKKIAKDMEKWAKTLNQKKENAKSGIVSAVNVHSEVLFRDYSGQPSTADAGFAVLEKRSSISERNALMSEILRSSREQEDQKMPFAVSPTEKMPPTLVAAYGGESDSDNEADNPDEGSRAFDALKAEELKLTDWSKLICLMCKRQLPTREALLKHQQFSDLHRQNLDVLKLKKLTPQQIVELARKEREAGYRDRAKERRKKFGQPDEPVPNKLKSKYLKELEEPVIPPEQPNARGIGSDNIGNKMLKAMGWSEGQGLGKSGQGMSDIIEVQRRAKTAGLGLKGSSYGVTASDSYKDAVKKAMQARYNEIA